jgi:hypothetical protein
MPTRSSLWSHLPFAGAFALALALAWPGVSARADGDLAPSSRELTRLGDAPPAARSPVAGDSCAASDPALAEQAQREAMQRIAEAMRAEGGSDFVALDGRGYGYFPERNLAVELARLQREAREQRHP